MAKKVGILGNMNNNHFALVRFLRDRGIDAHLLLFNTEMSHFHPSADTYDLDYMNYTTQLTWGDYYFSSTDFLRVRDDLSKYDILIGCGYAPAYCNAISRHLDIFAPYGDDIWRCTFYHLLLPHKLKNEISKVKNQREGISRSCIVNMGFTNDLYEKQIKKYCTKSKRWFDVVPMVYSGIYNDKLVDLYADKTHWYHLFQKIRNNSDVMIMSQARHFWSDDINNPNQKGNNILIEGFANFLKENRDIRAKLVLIEYGPSVHKSKRLIEELHINDNVIWFPQMYRKDLMVGLSMCDLVCDQFTHSWFTCGSTLEALALGKPLLKYLNDETKSHHKDIYPYFNAKDSIDIKNHLNSYLKSRDTFIKAGNQSREWYLDIVVSKTIDKYIDYIKSQ